MRALLCDGSAFAEWAGPGIIFGRLIKRVETFGLPLRPPDSPIFPQGQWPFRQSRILRLYVETNRKSVFHYISLANFLQEYVRT
jgi:hypothetical protein